MQKPEIKRKAEKGTYTTVDGPLLDRAPRVSSRRLELEIRTAVDLDNDAVD